MISVLCVDDDPAYLEIMKRFLEEPGALMVTTAPTVPDALRAMETDQFDAVVADYQMPVMNGIEFLRAVRAEYPRLPFILFTGKGREEVVIEAFNSGADFYLPKSGEPKIRFAELKDALFEAVKKGAGRNEFHDSEIRYRRLFETSRDGILILDAESGNITDANPLVLALLGYSRDEVLGKNIRDLGVIGEKTLAEKTAAELKTSGYSRYDDLPLKTKDGRDIAVEFTSNTYNVETQNVIQINLRNITERKQAEAALRESEERYRTLAEASPDQIFINGRDGTIQYANPAALKLLHQSYDQVVGRQRSGFFPPEIFKTQEASLNTVFETGESFRAEEMIHAGRNELWVDAQLVPLKDGAGIVNSVLGIARDVTQRKHAEEALKKTATLLNEVSEMAHAGGWEIDAFTKEVRWTNETYRIHEILDGEKLELSRVISFYDLPERSFLETALQRCFDHGEPFDLELPFTSNKGTHLWTRVRGRAVNVGGTVVKLTGTFQDITERKTAEETLKAFSDDLEKKVIERTSDLGDVNRNLLTEIGIRLNAEKQLTKSVGEKEVLLREVHHRVKNNLQIIISLLNLQSRSITDETTLSAFRESQNRVRAMALVHEKLYRSTDLSTIDLDNYIRFLAGSLLQFFGMKGKGITLRIDIRDIFLAIDTAIPFGLIVNELVSNSLKYAFPGGRLGDISLTIHRQDQLLTLHYKDNGVGIPAGFDWRNATSMGLRLVIILVDQLDGTIELDRSAGTAFTIVVKEKE